MKKALFLLVLASFSTSAFARMDMPEGAKFHHSERLGSSVAGSKSYKGVINGAKYQRYSDGSASFSNAATKKSTYSDSWSVSCKSDEMTDEKTCSVSNSGSRLFIWLEKGKGIASLTLFSHDFPGRNLSIRVGSGKPITVRRFINGSAAKKLISQMKPGVVVKTRHYHWPYDYSKDEKTTIDGNSLAEALNYAKWVLAGNFKPVGGSASAVVASPKAPAKSAGGLGHSHGGRSHSHPLPAQGKAHSHGGGPVGR